MNFDELFATLIIMRRLDFLYNITIWTLMNYLPVTPRVKTTLSCGIVDG